MKFVIDMNLSPHWKDILKETGWDAIHWSDVGSQSAPDKEILNWAKNHSFIVFTHDLDFGAILAATKTKSPSVVQIRIQDVNPDNIGKYVIEVIKKFKKHLVNGALVSIDKPNSRVRILPIN